MVPGGSVLEWGSTIPCREPANPIGSDMRLGSTTELCCVTTRLTRSSANSRHEPHPRPAPSRSATCSASAAEHSVPESHATSAAASTSCWSVTQLHRQTYTARPCRLNRRRIVNRNDSVLQQEVDPVERLPHHARNDHVINRLQDVPRNPARTRAALQVRTCTFWRADHCREAPEPQWRRTAPPNAQERDDCPNPAPSSKLLADRPWDTCIPGRISSAPADHDAADR